MKTASSRMKAHLAGDVTTLALLFKLTRKKDGQVFTFTTCSTDIDTSANQDPAGLTGISDGSLSPLSGYVYEAAIGISPTAIENKSDLSSDNQEVTCFIDSETIKNSDLRFGIWDGCDVEIRLVNYNDLTMGEVKLRKGTLGNLSWKSALLTAELLGLGNMLQQNLGRSYGAPCDAELGDSRCQATVPTHTGVIATSVSSHEITASGGTLNLTDGYYDDGVMTYTSGVNNGLSNQIDHWDGTTLTLKLQQFSAPSAGDTFTISPGCKHDPTDCRVKFGNFVNYQGFPTMPGQDTILQYPDATG
ncbi:MAG TPA: DUF2163 domain-containing protein [Terriglobales bacterium]|nr:DUF2163 domain-containing protein [Terriglobales bacterium]